MGLNIKSGIYDLKKLLRKSKLITLYKTPVQWTSTWFSASHSKKPYLIGSFDRYQYGKSHWVYSHRIPVSSTGFLVGVSGHAVGWATKVSWFNSRYERDILLFSEASRPILSPTLPPIQVVRRTVSTGTTLMGRKMTTDFHLVLSLRMSGNTPQPALVPYGLNMDFTFTL
jgi:hypothetical protein